MLSEFVYIENHNKCGHFCSLVAEYVQTENVIERPCSPTENPTTRCVICYLPSKLLMEKPVYDIIECPLESLIGAEI